jgi:hypothetical protein
MTSERLCLVWLSDLAASIPLAFLKGVAMMHISEFECLSIGIQRFLS